MVVHVIYNNNTRLLLRCIHNFETDLINNMDHLRFSDAERSSVILIQTK